MLLWCLLVRSASCCNQTACRHYASTVSIFSCFAPRMPQLGNLGLHSERAQTADNKCCMPMAKPLVDICLSTAATCTATWHNYCLEACQQYACLTLSSCWRTSGCSSMLHLKAMQCSRGALTSLT